MGAKNKNTIRAKQQLLLDEYRAEIESWYIDEGLTSLDIQEKLLKSGLVLTVGQIHYAFHRFGLKRDRNTKTAKLLVALKNRAHRVRPCRHCDENYQPNSGSQVYCELCAPNKSFCRRIQKYGVGKRQFDVMFQDQNGLCAICDNLLDEKDVAVDHDHVTLRVRGLLCKMCNLRLHVVEDSKFLIRAIDYLKRNHDVEIARKNA